MTTGFIRINTNDPNGFWTLPERSVPQIQPENHVRMIDFLNKYRVRP